MSLAWSDLRHFIPAWVNVQHMNYFFCFFAPVFSEKSAYIIKILLHILSIFYFLSPAIVLYFRRRFACSKCGIFPGRELQPCSSRSANLKISHQHVINQTYLLFQLVRITAVLPQWWFARNGCFPHSVVSTMLIQWFLCCVAAVFQKYKYPIKPIKWFHIQNSNFICWSQFQGWACLFNMAFMLCNSVD